MDDEFKPELTPKEMLELGVFGGIYFDEKSSKEFPKDWFENAQLSLSGEYDTELNYYQVKASQPLEVWQAKGWINPQDPMGWFQWYCRYSLGRRTDDDERVAQVKKGCRQGDQLCRRKQRQALLHWAYDSRSI